ncbi:hypothetical protein WCLP8_5180003 [uncultured Gammaproteobacteria bacterium]
MQTGFPPDAGAPVARVQVTFTPDPETLPKDVLDAAKRGFTLEFVIDPGRPIDPAINAILAGDPYFAAQGVFALDLGAAGAITAERESRAPLPAWLGFDAETLSFTGLPPANFVGVVPVRLEVSGNGGSLPDFSLLTEVAVDPTYHVNPFAHGFATTTSAERISLSAPADFNGSVVIRYTAADEKGAVSAEPATIVFNVTPAPERPLANADAFEVREAETVSFRLTELLTNDRDDDGNRLRITAISDAGNGALSVALTTVAFDAPAALAAAGASWTATLADGSALPDWMTCDTDTGRIAATIPLDIRRDFAIVWTRTLDGITDQSSSSLFLDGNQATVTYTPGPGFSGPDSFGYTLTDDSQGAVTGTVTLNVLSRFDPPHAETDHFEIPERTPLILTPADLLANDHDVDGNAIRFLGVLNPVNGTVDFDGTNIIFTPRGQWNGVAGFDYTVTDDVDGASVGHAEILVRSTNRAPTPGARLRSSTANARGVGARAAPKSTLETRRYSRTVTTPTRTSRCSADPSRANSIRSFRSSAVKKPPRIM